MWTALLSWLKTFSQSGLDKNEQLQQAPSTTPPLFSPFAVAASLYPPCGVAAQTRLNPAGQASNSEKDQAKSFFSLSMSRLLQQV